jgi:haloalkane dehalogenase
VLRTPQACFDGLADYPFAPHYLQIDAGDDDGARAAGALPGRGAWRPSGRIRRDDPAAARRTVLELRLPARHPTAGGRRPPLRGAPDLVGFGRSDKLADRFAYTYRRHVDWLRATVLGLDLRDVTLVCQDWGGLLGLRLLAEQPDRFRRVVATNTSFPTGDEQSAGAYAYWLQFSQRANPFDIGQVVDMGTVSTLDPAVRAAYNAPFPDEAYLAGARQFPLLVHITPHDEASPANRQAWTVLEQLNIPFLCAFSDRDWGGRRRRTDPAGTRGGRRRAAPHHHRQRRPLRPGGPGPRTRRGHQHLHHLDAPPSQPHGRQRAVQPE